MLVQSFGLVVPLALAALLGALVGLERQWRQRQAGLRTNALVALGAASFTLMSMMVEGEVSPTRVAAQVVSGIGFLGAGVILKEGANIRGLNTAATLWCSAAIGVMAGAGYFLAAALVTGVILTTNTLLRPLVSVVNRQPLQASSGELEWAYQMKVSCTETQEAHIRALLLQGLLEEGALRLQKLESEHLDGKVSVTANLLAPERRDLIVEKLVGRLSLESSVSAAGWDVRAH
ncbi:MgtC/SapB family protein [Desulfurispira natronophila]|uniref:Protein MgtC n=1 Tax=Desulfurispira natronophila TaxID=682562 RepID=A0A7W7Y6Z3_9BACT|nr:MgtC/SapB family protein [Desulfurispira natronophila]MBB5022887.1 putative Mg2+ transporter-C (MgtC) family protein [Desulfurispira natronophila]